jgi:hypothetical protein|tara:strand:+ start:10 stop:144 length:135 start_codon:yes stop_codon:yes gene_type:complete
MEDITFESPEIYKKDQKQINKIIDEVYQYLYDLIKKDIKNILDK